MSIDVVGEFDEAECLAELFLDRPRQIRRIDREAVPADAGARGELHEAKWLCRRGIDHLPDVDTEVMGEHGELVDKRDVHMAERVLEQFGHLGLAGAANRDGLVDEPVVEPLDFDRRSRSDPAHDLGCVHQAPDRVTRVDAFRGVPEVVVDFGGQAGGVFDARRHELIGRTRVGRRFQDDGRVRSKMWTQQVDRRFDVTEVGSVVAQWRRDRNDRNVKAAKVVGVRSWEVVACANDVAQFAVGDVFDMGLTLSKSVRFGGIDVVADNAEPGSGSFNSNR